MASTFLSTQPIRGWRRYATRLNSRELDAVIENREAYLEAGATGDTPEQLRLSYLEGLQEEHGASDEVMDALLSCLPADEDFDGFVTMLEDHAGRDDL